METNCAEYLKGTKRCQLCQLPILDTLSSELLLDDTAYWVALLLLGGSNEGGHMENQLRYVLK